MLDSQTLEEARARTAALTADAAVTTEVESALSTGDDRAVEPVAIPDRLRLAMARRAAFHRAMAALRTRGQADQGPIRTALADANAEGIVTASVQHAIGVWLELECQRPGTFLHGLSHELETELVAAIYADPAGAKAVDDEYVRQYATAASTMDEHLFDHRGLPTAPRPPTLSLLRTLVQR